MQCLSWADIQIPVVFVTGLSMKKSAKTIEHSGGFISSRGFEAAEISCQIECTRARCMTAGLDFNEWFGIFDALPVERNAEAGLVTLGGYPLYPELKFALTNKNTTKVTDMASSAPMSIACDLVLSGVECVKEVFRQRTLEFMGEPSELPKISLTVDGKTLVVQDTYTVSKMEITPGTCEIEVCLGADRNNVNRGAFLKSLVDGKEAIVTVGMATGDAVFHVIRADLTSGILQISGSIYSEAANQTVTKTFEDCRIGDVIGFLCDRLGIKAEILVDGAVDYYRLNSTPMEALEGLQRSAGFVVSGNLGRVTFAFLPDEIEPQRTLGGLAIEEDGMDELVSGIVWRDGENEAIVGDEKGEILKVESVFRSSQGGSFARECLKRAKYNANAMVVSGELDVSIRHHSQIAIPKDTGEVAGIVDYYVFDFVSGEMRLEVHGLG